MSKPVKYQGNQSTGGSCYICTRTRGLISGVRILFEYLIREHSFRVFQSHIDRGFCFTIQKSLDFNLSDQRLRFEVDDTSKTFWSPTSIAHARKWLHTCLTKHPECTQQARFTESRQLPTRLTQVDRKDGEMKSCLKITSALSPDIRYLTLSHRWGDNNFIVLTAGRLSRFLKRIPIDHVEFN
ncbi:hypothetical protein GGR51DRAFT_541118 [Nemania sp. FL0031]|nr:hypothetical protein GGR51DRAFT_541118 [Nemania sp. FL0031]